MKLPSVCYCESIFLTGLAPRPCVMLQKIIDYVWNIESDSRPAQYFLEIQGHFFFTAVWSEDEGGRQHIPATHVSKGWLHIMSPKKKLHRSCGRAEQRSGNDSQPFINNVAHLAPHLSACSRAAENKHAGICNYCTRAFALHEKRSKYNESGQEENSTGTLDFVK